MVELDVLAVGWLAYAEDGTIKEAHSTSTLVRAEGRTIVVDTSSKEMKPALKILFKQIGVFPKDVDTVVLTHTHSDHSGNLDMFPGAQVIHHSGEKGEIKGARVIVEETLEIAKGVKLVHTPGHTPGSMSVFVEADRRYVIAGDAVPLEDNYLKMVPPGQCCDARLALQSLKSIVSYADVVVPGHGFPFMTSR